MKQAVPARWGTVPLTDMLKEAVLRTGCLQSVTSVAGHGSLPEHILAERLLLAIYGYGTNTGIRAVAASEHGHGEDEIRYARRRTRRTSARSTRTSSPSGTPVTAAAAC